MNVTQSTTAPECLLKLISALQQKYDVPDAEALLQMLDASHAMVAKIAVDHATSVTEIREEIKFMFYNLDAIAARGNGISEVQSASNGMIVRVSDPITLTSMQSRYTNRLRKQWVIRRREYTPRVLVS